MSEAQRSSLFAGAQLGEMNDFAALLDREFKPKSDRAREAVEAAVQTLAQQALAHASVISDDSLRSIEAMIVAIDRKLSEQVNLVLHHEDFQGLESAWRGLHHLVNNTETDETLKIKVFNISKKELGRTLKKFRGTAWDQSPIFKKVYEEEFGQFGGEPFGMLVGDYYFDHSPTDVQLLADVAQIAAGAHAPFITAANSTLMGMDSWSELANPRDLTKIFGTPEYAAWRSLRESDDARYLGLTMPRFLARLPYGAKTEPVEEFAFEEDIAASEGLGFTWANSAYAMATNITRAFKLYGWTTQIRGIESGGAVEGLPVYSFPTDDGGVAMQCPTEVSIADRREAELAKSGLMPLIHKKNSDFAAFIGAQSLQKPQEYEDAAATANANLSARLPYLFATCRFAHYLKCMVRDKIGSSMTQSQLQTWLQNWIMRFVDGSPGSSDDAYKATHPLAAGNVVVEADESNPGYYSTKIYLMPHYQLEGLTVSLRLVSRMPK
jgi:type VI secretion system protein ImpC